MIWHTFEQKPLYNSKILVLFKNQDIWPCIYQENEKLSPLYTACNIKCEKPNIDIRGDIKWIGFDEII